MKTKFLIILVMFGFAVTGISIFFYIHPPFAYYDLEIQGMKDTYHTGEEYSFYYTLTGYGNTCHSWTVSFPDKNGKIQHRGEAVDCITPTNKKLDYDSRTELRQFSSKVPMTEGKYNVTVSLENLEPVIYEFKVLPENNEIKHIPIEKLLVENNVDFDSNTLAVAGGITYYGGDPGCGAVMDNESNVHWFHVDSISYPTNMTLHSENPNPCKINHNSCFCNAQIEFTAITLDELSYLTSEQEQQVGNRVKKYFETMPHGVSPNKFVVGKYNFDMGEKYTGICGAIVTDSTDFSPNGESGDEISIHGYFSGYLDGPRLWDFSLSVDNENLCAISDEPTIFEFQKLDE